jgi:hypothetical protein
MKPQDIIWIVVLVLLVILRKEKLALSVGMLCLVVAIPLFAKHIFFTAERLVMYASSFILLSTILMIRDIKK